MTSAPNPENNACCALSEWTGVATSSIGANLIQGGVLWQGYKLPTLSGSVNGFDLFVETPTGSNPYPVLISPPSWMGGVKGDVILMNTYVYDNCAGPGDVWWESWQYGGYVTSQSIGCYPLSYFTYGTYILESTASKGAPSLCSNQGYPFTLGGVQYYACQLPEFTNGGSGLPFNSVTICGQVSSNQCRGLNANGDPVTQYWINHNAQDTTTSTIPSNGNSWYEQWISSQ